MKQLAYIILTAVFVYYACLGGGRTLLRLLKIGLYRSEERFLAFVLGSGCLSIMVFAIAALHLAYKGVFLAIGILFIALGGIAIRGRTLASLPPLAPFWRAVFWSGYVVYAVLYLANGVLPETSPDGMGYHLGLIAQYHRAHSFLWLTTSIEGYSQGIDILFLFAFPFGKHAGAAMVHVLFLLTLPAGMLSYARRFGIQEAGVVGALLVFMSPIIGKDGVSAYVDIALAAVVFAAFYFLQIWAAERKRQLLIPIGLLCGFGYTVKYLAFVAFPYALLFIVFHLRKARREAIRSVLVVSGCAAVMAAPLVIKNAVVWGNPLSPFANSVFRNPFVHVSFDKETANAMLHLNGVTYRDLPWELCVSGERLLGLLGPVFLLSLLAIAAVRYPQGRQLLIAAGVFCILPMIAFQTRFFIPAVPFVAMALAMVLCRWPPIGLAVLALHAVLSWPPVVALYADGAWRIRDLPWRAVLRLESEERYLATTGLGEDDYEMRRLINSRVPAGQPIFSLSGFPRSWSDRDIIVHWESAFGERMRDTLATGMWESMSRTEYRFTERPLEKIRIVQTGASDLLNWGINEVRFYRAGSEVSRSPAWRLSARPNPWDVQLASDNNPSTRWSTWEAFRPGMYMEVDFGGGAQVDEVVVESSPDWSERVHLETWGSGHWQAIDSKTTVEVVERPSGLRRAAAAYLKANGLHWLHFNLTEWCAKDFVLNSDRWGITLAGASPTQRLYHID